MKVYVSFTDSNLDFIKELNLFSTFSEAESQMNIKYMST